MGIIKQRVGPLVIVKVSPFSTLSKRASKLASNSSTVNSFLVSSIGTFSMYIHYTKDRPNSQPHSRKEYEDRVRSHARQVFQERLELNK